jgi:hypothetical protein
MNFRLAASVVLVLSISAVPQPPRKSVPPSSKPAESDTSIYRDPAFGFRYRIPYGWVDRTKDLQQGNDSSKGEVLLAVFERPPQATGDTVNSAVVIGAEKLATDSGVKKAEDYLGTLVDLTTSQDFKLDGDPSELEIGPQRMVRADFSKALNDKVTMHQATLLMFSKGQILSLTFVAGSVDAVNDLIEGLSFSSQKSKAR